MAMTLARLILVAGAPALALLLGGVGLGAAGSPTPTTPPILDPLGRLEFDYRYSDVQTEVGRIETTRVIRGQIPLWEVNPHLGTIWCLGEFQETVNHDIVGEGTLHGTESQHTVDPSGVLDCRMDNATFTIKVEIRGKTWWKPNENTPQCSDNVVSISFEAEHSHDLQGVMRCTTKNGPAFEQPVQQEARSGKKRAATIYNTGFTPLSETIEFQIFDGMYFERTLTSGGSTRRERITLHQPHPEHPDLTKPSLRYESPPPDPTQVRHAIIGPPLSQVPYGIPQRPK